MRSVAGLYDQFRKETRWVNDIEDVMGLPPSDNIRRAELRRKEKEEREAAEKAERLKKEQQERRRTKRPPFNFEKASRLLFLPPSTH